MKRFPLALGLLVLAATAGCGSATPGLTARGESWISPDAGTTRALLFESDYGFGSVEMFSLPDLKLKGVVTGFSGPLGMCSDTSGDVYVVNAEYPSGIVELSHSGGILRHISDFYATPEGCAVNPTNGDLAVGNVEGNSQEGMVSLFPRAESSYDRWLRCSTISSYWFVGYDPQGYLFTNGLGNAGPHLCRGTDNNDKLSPVKVKGLIIDVPGMIAWDGKYLAVGDTQCIRSNASCIYQIAISGNKGKIVGTIKPLAADGSPFCNLVQGVIEPGSSLMLLGGGVASACGQNASVDIWPYPAGGLPSNSYDNFRFINQPMGAAISVKS